VGLIGVRIALIQRVLTPGAIKTVSAESGKKECGSPSLKKKRLGVGKEIAGAQPIVAIGEGRKTGKRSSNCRSQGAI